MSTEGAGAVAGVAVIAGGGVALAGAAVIGAGVLIAQGIMWCGGKLEENYRGACQQWTDVAEAARRENFANVQETSIHIALQVDRLAASAYLTVNNVTSQAPTTVEEKEIADTIARTRHAIRDAQAMVQDRAASEKALLAARLQAEINAGRGILPSETLALAQTALNAPVTEMQKMLNTLLTAWDNIHEVEAVRMRQISQTRQVVQIVTTQIYALETMLREEKRSSDPRYMEQQATIETLIRDAQTYLDVNPATALLCAQKAQKEVRTLVESIAVEEVARAHTTRKEINTIRGVLNTLEKMLNEANSVKLLAPQRTASLLGRLTKAQQEALTLSQGERVSHAAITRLQAQVTLLKEDVFAALRGGQQNNVAQLIAETLAELGFQANEGHQPVIKTNGDIMRVEALIAKGTGVKRDEKVVAFDISPEGKISYDFSGYVGDSCIHDAQRVFEALRARGVFIVDDRANEELLAMPVESITINTLHETHFHPRITRNKSQAELAESLKRVLEKMGYPLVQQSSIGGAIELEAFKGSVGYRVVLPSDGSAQILKDTAHADVSDTGDPVAREAKRTIQQEGQKKEQAKSTRRKLPKRQIVQN